MTARLSVNINDECADALRRVTARRDISVTEAIRRAISLLDHFEKAGHAEAHLVDGSRVWKTLDATQEPNE